VIDKLKQLFNHERYQAIGVIVCIALAIWLVSCESQVRSIIDPTKKVNRNELQAEADYTLSLIADRMEDLSRQDELKKLLLQNALLFSEAGTINPYGLIVGIAGILGIGATVDNVRKRQTIKKLENGNSNS